MTEIRRLKELSPVLRLRVRLILELNLMLILKEGIKVNKDLPVVSVIITTKNEEKNIENCLKSVQKQDYDKEKLEIIVVDNNSTDRTKEIASQFTDKIFDKGPERSAQRNFGAEKSYGKYILYLDADMILSEKVISECVMKSEKGRIVGLYIPEVIIGSGFWIKVRNFERSFYNATCIDAVRFILREKFLEINGFDLSMTGPEDWDLDRRLEEKGKLDIIVSNLFHNEGSFNLRKYISKKGYYSKSFDSYIEKWGSKDKIIRKQLGLYYRFTGVFIERSNWRKILIHPFLAGSMYFLRFLVGVTFVLKK